MCEARQYCDEMVCYACSLRWDVHDDEPPECNPKTGQGVKVPGGSRPTNRSLATASFAFVRSLLSNQTQPKSMTIAGTAKTKPWTNAGNTDSAVVIDNNV